MLRKILCYANFALLIVACSGDSNDSEEPVQAVLPTVNTISANTITAVSATLGGNVTDDGDASVTARGVAWGVNSNPTISGNRTSNGKGTGEFSTTLSGLEKNTLYHYRAYATNSEGTSYGSDMTFTTNATLAVLTTNEISEITDASALSGGVITDDGGVNITAKGLCWSVNSNPTMDDNFTEDGSGVEDFTSQITGLEPNTQYYVRSYAVSEEGISYGNELIFTSEPALASLTTKEVTEIGQISAISGMNITANGGAEITSQGICWSTSSNPTIEDTMVAMGSGLGEFEITMQDLLPNTQYFVRAFATNEAGTAYGQEISFTTLEVSTVYDGDVVLLTQQEVDDFGSNNFLEITGSLTIGDNTGIISDITNLDALSSLETLGNYLAIYNNDQLENLNGLSGITSIGGDLLVGMNDLFIEIDGLSNITTIGGALEIYSNDLLQNIQGISNVTSLGGGATIRRNESLASLVGFPSMVEINGPVSIRDNNALTSLEGLDNLRSVVGGFEVSNESQLANISAISNLESVQGIFVLSGTRITEINGFNNLTLVSGGIEIASNSQLTSILGFSNITSTGSVRIQYNDQLESISGFEGLTSIMGDLNLVVNSSLTSIDTFTNLSVIEGELRFSSTSTSDMGFLANLTFVGGAVYIGNSSTLVSLSGLGKLEQIGNGLIISNTQITSIADGLSGLITVGGSIDIRVNLELLSVGFATLTNVLGDIQITSNPVLTDYCGLQSFFLNDGLTGSFSTSGNAFNPTQQNIIDGTCSN